MRDIFVLKTEVVQECKDSCTHTDTHTCFTPLCVRNKSGLDSALKFYPPSLTQGDGLLPLYGFVSCQVPIRPSMVHKFSRTRTKFYLLLYSQQSLMVMSEWVSLMFLFILEITDADPCGLRFTRTSRARLVQVLSFLSDIL